MKYYAVAKGRKTGVFVDWNEVLEYVKGFSGAKYASFHDKESAENYVSSGGVKQEVKAPESSFIKNTKNMGRVYAQCKRDDANGKFIISGVVDTPNGLHQFYNWSWLEDYTDLSEVDIQCYAYVHMLKEAFKLGIRDIVVVYKNDCFKGWGETWKAKSDVAKYYKSCIQYLRSRCNIQFEKYDKGIHYHMEYGSRISLPFEYKSEQYEQFGYTGNF